MSRPFGRSQIPVGDGFRHVASPQQTAKLDRLKTTRNDLVLTACTSRR